MKNAPLFVIESVTMTDKNDGHVIRNQHHAREFKDHKSVVDYMESRTLALKNKGYTIKFTDDGRVNCTNPAIGQTRVIIVCEQRFFSSKEAYAKNLMGYILRESQLEEPTESLNALMKKAFGDSYHFT
jgi:hypothetical protein